MTNFEELYSIKTLAQMPQKKEETLKLIEKSFNYSSDQSFEIDFLPLMSQDNSKNCHLLIEKSSNNVIGHIGVCPRMIALNNKEHPCALLGGICLDESFRGKKIFKKFFEIVLLSIESDYNFTLLWSGEPELYLKNSFHLAIEQVSYALKEFKKESPYTLKKNLNDLEKEQIKNCFNTYIKNKFQCLARNDKDWEIIFQMKSVEFWVHFENDKIQSYFLRSKGQDLNGIIHELAIDKLEDFASPIEEGFLWYPVKNPKFSFENHFGAIVRLSNMKLINEYLQDHLSSRLIIKEFDAKDVHFVFEGNNYHYPINEFLCGLWGPGQFEELAQTILPFYIPGVDSI